MTETQLQDIKRKAESLSLQDHIRLIEVLAHQLAVKSQKSQDRYDWSALYGLGRGLWDGEDAQEYVKRMREDRNESDRPPQ